MRHQKTEARCAKTEFLKLEEESTLPPLKVKEGMEEKQQEVARLAVRSWRQSYNSWFRTPGLQDSGTPRLWDSKTPRL